MSYLSSTSSLVSFPSCNRQQSIVITVQSQLPYTERSSYRAVTPSNHLVIFLQIRQLFHSATCLAICVNVKQYYLLILFFKPPSYFITEQNPSSSLRKHFYQNIAQQQNLKDIFNMPLYFSNYFFTWKVNETVKYF